MVKIPIKQKPIVDFNMHLTWPKINFKYREIKLLPFQLETGNYIKANYIEEEDRVVMTVHPDMKDRMSVGLAANYIEFILSLPTKVRY